MKYIHGGSPEYYFRRFNLPEREVIDFSVNINPLGPPPIVKKIWNKLLDNIPLYPTVDGQGVRAFYKKRFSIPDEFILSGNGSTELIYLLPRALALNNVAILKPSYYDYERASIIAGSKVLSIYLDPYDIDMEKSKRKLMDSIKIADAIWIGRPNNPTGHMILKDIINEISEAFPKKWIIIDEAFIQFVKNWEDETFISADMPKNILVIHSLTKFYALTGIRIGALISRPENISLMSSKKEPWSINGIAEQIAKYLYPCDEYEKKTVLMISKEREKLYRVLSLIKDMDPLPSKANFILCRWERDLDELLRYLLKKGIYVRDCRNFDGLSGNFFRIGIKNPKENELLISCLLSI